MISKQMHCFLSFRAVKFLSLTITTVVFCGTFVWGPKTLAVTNKELKIGISQEFEILNPIIRSMLATEYLSGLSLRGLVTMDAKAQWVPILAKEIPSLKNKKAKLIDDNGVKKIQAVWEILEKASWGDGKPVTCADFELAWRIGKNLNVSVGDRETYDQIEKISWDAKEPKKCTFKYAKARWDFYFLGTFFPVPKHLEEEIYEKNKDQKEGYDRATTYVKNPTAPGLYNGPYRITELKLGDHLSFERNPHFYGTPAKIEKIIVKLIPNTGTLEANLRSGTIDMISSLGLDMDQAIKFDETVNREKLNYKTHFVPSLTYEHIDVNLDNAFLKDIKVRKALLLSINREDLVKSLYHGKLKTADHLFAPRDPWYSVDPKKVSVYKYDKKTAEKLLTEAGWKMESDGFRHKDGQKLSFTFMTTAGNKTRELVQVYLQREWKKVGVEVVIKNEPARVFFGETTRKRKFEGLAMYAWVAAPESIPRSTTHSTAIPSEKNSWAGQNCTGWSNAEVDKSIDALELEFNPEVRKTLAINIAKEYTQDLPVLPLYYRSDISVVPKSLQNYEMTGHQFSETNSVEKWSLE